MANGYTNLCGRKESLVDLEINNFIDHDEGKAAEP